MPLARMDAQSKTETPVENKTADIAQAQAGKAVGKGAPTGGRLPAPLSKSSDSGDGGHLGSTSVGFVAATKKISYWSTVFSVASELVEKRFHEFVHRPFTPSNALPLAAYYKFGSWMAIGTVFGGVFGVPSALEKIRADIRNDQCPSLSSSLLAAGVTGQTFEGILYHLRMVYKIPMPRVAWVGALADASKMGHYLRERKWMDGLFYGVLTGAHVSVALGFEQDHGQVSHSPSMHWRGLQPLLKAGPKPLLVFGVAVAGAQGFMESRSGVQSSEEASVSVEAPGFSSERERRIVDGNGV